MNISKKSAAVALALLLMTTAALPNNARAQSISELQQQINQLLAQIAVLQAQLGGTPAQCTTFTRNLSIGTSGPDVLALQKFLNRSADTRVSVSGAGAPGFETQYYGPATAAAVSKFQVKYRAEVLTPSGLVNPTGFFGAATRAKMNALCTVVVPPVTNPGNNDGNNGTTSPLKGGEAQLRNFQTDDGDDTSLEEGQKNAPVMDVEFDVEDGDIRIDRVDVAFDHISGGDDDPWDVFKNVSIWAGKKQLASLDVDNRRVWSENQPNSGDYRVRIGNIDHIVREGDTAALTVAVTLANNVDDAGAVDWEVFIPNDGIRATDSLKLTHYIGDTDETVRFNISEAGADAELTVRTSSDDPDASVLSLNRSTNSDWLPVFAFELDADDSADDITINSLPITVEVSDGETFNNLVRNARLVIDGKRYTRYTVDSGNSDTAVLNFEFRRDELVIDSGDSAEITLELEFRPLAEADEGTQLRAFVTSAQADDIDAEGREDLTASQISGSATGEMHTLRTGGTTLANVSTTATLKANSSATVDDDEGVYTIRFDVTAFGNDLYINRTAANGTTTGTAGVNYVLEDSSGNTVTTGTANAALTSNATISGGRYRIAEGQTRTFTLTVNYDPTVRGFYQLQLYSINFNDTSADPDTFQRALPESRYQTQPLSI